MAKPSHTTCREGIENVRKNGKVSSLYPYEAVVRVYMKNVKSFVIDYKNAKHSYQYRSTVRDQKHTHAPHRTHTHAPHTHTVG